MMSYFNNYGYLLPCVDFVFSKNPTIDVKF